MNCGRPMEDAENYLRRYWEILDRMIRGMTGAEKTDSISHNFIVQMIPHHRAAIEMSENLLKFPVMEPLAGIARSIITEQTRSIENMQAALNCCARMCNTEEELCRYEKRFRQITETMFSQMSSACADGNISGDFMREMIPHHQGAIRMSKNALQYPICQELTPILRAIIISQEKGVREMQHLLCR